MTHWLDKVITILEAETSSLRELARLAGGDPRTFYKGVDVKKLDLNDQDIQGMEFSDSASQTQSELELRSHQEELPTKHVAASIKHRRRQEERAALLLAEFLEDRLRGMQIIENYSHDKANLTNSVLRVLKDARQKEVEEQRQFTNLQIARKVSGCFARTVEKRAILVYYFAKYLHSYPEIRQWLKGKSLGWLSRPQKQEVERLLRDPTE